MIMAALGKIAVYQRHPNHVNQTDDNSKYTMTDKWIYSWVLGWATESISKWLDISHSQHIHSKQEIKVSSPGFHSKQSPTLFKAEIQINC